MGRLNFVLPFHISVYALGRFAARSGAGVLRVYSTTRLMGPSQTKLELNRVESDSLDPDDPSQLVRRSRATSSTQRIYSHAHTHPGQTSPRPAVYNEQGTRLGTQGNASLSTHHRIFITLIAGALHHTVDLSTRRYARTMDSRNDNDPLDSAAAAYVIYMPRPGPQIFLSPLLGV